MPDRKFSQKNTLKKLKNHLIIRTNFFGTSKLGIKKFCTKIINYLKREKNLYI